MSVFKPFITSDVTVVPFEVNKQFTFKGVSEFVLPNVRIERYIGVNNTSSLWVSGSNTTGLVTLQDQTLIYRSVRELYYTNFLQKSTGSPAATVSFNVDGTISGIRDTTNYYNYLTTTLPPNRKFPTGSGATIGVYSIPSNLFGEYIKPGSFSLETPYATISDDSLGNLTLKSSYFDVDGIHVGNIIYEHGMSILDKSVFEELDAYGTAIYGSSIYGGAFGTFFGTNNITCSFESTVTIYESQYKCTIRQNEFNFSQNPTVLGPPDQGYDINYYDEELTYEDDAIYDGYDLSALNSNIYPWATGSYFTPYITTVGLYNNNKELLAVAKLAQPLPISSVTDTNIIINLDL
jgi:hypothetical protein